MILKSSLGSNYTVTETSFSSSAAITGLQLTIPEDGYYDIRASLSCLSDDADGTEGDLRVGLSIDNVVIPSTVHRIGQQYTTADFNLFVGSTLVSFEYLKKDQVVTVEAIHDSGDNSVILGTITSAGSESGSKLEAINLTKLARGGV